MKNIIKQNVKLGNIYGEQFTGMSYGGGVWSKRGLCPCLKSSGSSGQEFIVVKVNETNISRKPIR